MKKYTDVLPEQESILNRVDAVIVWSWNSDQFGKLIDVPDSLLGVGKNMRGFEAFPVAIMRIGRQSPRDGASPVSIADSSSEPCNVDPRDVHRIAGQDSFHVHGSDSWILAISMF